MAATCKQIPRYASPCGKLLGVAARSAPDSVNPLVSRRYMRWAGHCEFSEAIESAGLKNSQRAPSRQVQQYNTLSNFDNPGRDKGHRPMWHQAVKPVLDNQYGITEASGNQADTDERRRRTSQHKEFKSVRSALGRKSKKAAWCQFCYPFATGGKSVSSP